MLFSPRVSLPRDVSVAGSVFKLVLCFRRISCVPWVSEGLGAVMGKHETNVIHHRCRFLNVAVRLCCVINDMFGVKK